MTVVFEIIDRSIVREPPSGDHYSTINSNVYTINISLQNSYEILFLHRTFDCETHAPNKNRRPEAVEIVNEIRSDRFNSAQHRI